MKKKYILALWGIYNLDEKKIKHAGVCYIADNSNNNNNGSWYLSNSYYITDSSLRILHGFTHSTLTYDINVISFHSTDRAISKCSEDTNLGCKIVKERQRMTNTKEGLHETY